MRQEFCFFNIWSKQTKLGLKFFLHDLLKCYLPKNKPQITKTHFDTEQNLNESLTYNVRTYVEILETWHFRGLYDHVRILAKKVLSLEILQSGKSLKNYHQKLCCWCYTFVHYIFIFLTRQIYRTHVMQLLNFIFI